MDVVNKKLSKSANWRRDPSTYCGSRNQLYTGVNAAGDVGDTSPQYFGWGDVNGNIPPILLRTFGYSRPILVALRSLSLKPISFGYKTPPIRFSQAGGQSAHEARPPNLELALTPLVSRKSAVIGSVHYNAVGLTSILVSLLFRERKSQVLHAEFMRQHTKLTINLLKRS